MTMNQNVEFARALSAWGADLLPEDAAAAIATWTAASNVGIEHDPVSALRAAAQAGDLTAENVVDALADAAVTLAAAERARSLVAELHHPLGSRFAAALAANAERILDRLRPRFDEAAAALTDAARMLPETATAETVVAGGVDAVAAWQALAQASAALDSIANIRITLARQYGYSEPSPAVAAFIGPVAESKDLTKADYLWSGREARVDHIAWLDPAAPGGKWAALARRGYELRLNNAVDAQRIAACQPVRDPDPVAA